MSRAVSVDLELQDSMRLDVLAVEINEAHYEAEQMAQGALERAKAAGERLNEAKSLCKHGEWLGWLSSKFSGSARKAQRYMRLADQWDELEAKNDTVSHLGVRQALELLSEPRESEEPEIEPTEVTPSPEVLLRRVESFKEPRITALFKSHEITVENAVLLGHIKNRGMSETLDALLEHGSDEAKVRHSKPQLEHLLKQNEAGQSDTQTAELVERVENGETSSVFEVHQVRQEERREQVRQRSAFDRLDESDQVFVEQFASTYLSGYGGDKSREDISRDVLRFSENREGWGDLDFDEKQSVMLEHFGSKQAKRYDRSDKAPITRVPADEIKSLETACLNLVECARNEKGLTSFTRQQMKDSLEQVNAIVGRMLA